jgi:hypothetical protein
MKKAILGLLISVSCWAQQVVAPTQLPVGPTTGERASDYNIMNSMETGYRYISTNGNSDEYRSQVNYDGGVRLLASSFSMYSRDGHGKYFDEFVLTTQGLGNDPYESAVLRVAKNRLFRFDMSWGLNDYYNPGLASAGQQSGNFRDTRYTTQDDDLTLFPQSKIKFFLGYSRGVQEGPEFTSVGGIFSSIDTTGFTSVREARNEYRLGNEFQIFGVKLNWLHGWEDFKEDFHVPANQNDEPSPASFTNPYHGTSPYWRVALFTDKKWFSMNGRFTYTGTRRAYVSEQSGFLGAVPNLGPFQVVTMGTGHRPVATGNLIFSLTLGPKLTITNSTALYNVRMDGNSQFLQLDNETGQFVVQDFQSLGIRTISNQTDLNYQARKWIGFFGGYTYSDRLIRSVLGLGLPATDQTNVLNAGLFGVRIRPVQTLTILLDGEVGRTNRPFVPTSDRNYQALNARVQYKRKSLMLSAYAQSTYNNNSTSLTAYSSHARTYAANVSWTPLRWLAFNADYVKLHLDTLGGLSFFEDDVLLPNQYSLYISNLYTGNVGARFVLGKRIELYAGYSHVQDAGDGRSNPVSSGFGTTIPEFQAAQTFPLKYVSPLGRVSVRITNRIRWNLGYQYYGYRENFFTGGNFLPDAGYRANTGYTSVLWSF